MARGFSNRERIQRLALEAELAAKERAERASSPSGAARPATRKPSATPPASGRRKVVWTVYDPGHREVEDYPYAKREEAEAHARELTERTGKEHFVRDRKVPM